MLFSSDVEGKQDLKSLSRNELIALVNTAAQLAKSVGSVPGWRWLGETWVGGKGGGEGKRQRQRRIDKETGREGKMARDRGRGT